MITNEEVTELSDKLGIDEDEAFFMLSIRHGKSDGDIISGPPTKYAIRRQTRRDLAARREAIVELLDSAHTSSEIKTSFLQASRATITLVIENDWLGHRPKNMEHNLSFETVVHIDNTRFFGGNKYPVYLAGKALIGSR